ncbi:MAG: hypothetical protein OK439_04945 [Thaumarchaeota archaeon]|nr:hypothetical protein [Nitrososphaerota archaeon]
MGRIKTNKEVDEKHLSSRPTKNAGVPSVPPLDPSTQRQRLARLAWYRVGFGALAGFLASVLGLVTPTVASPDVITSLKNNIANPNAYYGIYIAIIIFLASYYFAKYSVLKGIAPKDKNRLITQGIGTYIMMFIFTWILFNTFNYCTLFAACHL